jgi:hypothetical protein
MFLYKQTDTQLIIKGGHRHWNPGTPEVDSAVLHDGAGDMDLYFWTLPGQTGHPADWGAYSLGNGYTQRCPYPYSFLSTSGTGQVAFRCADDTWSSPIPRGALMVGAKRESSWGNAVAQINVRFGPELIANFSGTVDHAAIYMYINTDSTHTDDAVYVKAKPYGGGETLIYNGTNQGPHIWNCLTNPMQVGGNYKGIDIWTEVHATHNYTQGILYFDRIEWRTSALDVLATTELCGLYAYPDGGVVGGAYPEPGETGTFYLI